MMDLVIITLGVIVGFPLLVALMSFVTWENGFQILGRNYIIRMIIVLLIFSWVIYFIQDGAALKLSSTTREQPRPPLSPVRYSSSDAIIAQSKQRYSWPLAFVPAAAASLS